MREGATHLSDCDRTPRWRLLRIRSAGTCVYSCNGNALHVHTGKCSVNFVNAVSLADLCGQLCTRVRAGAGANHPFLTSKERDIETGLDYFNARYFSSIQGRFTGADPIMMKKGRLLDPQRINLHAYVRNNPLKFIDPDGADLILAENLKSKQREFIVKNLARLYD